MLHEDADLYLAAQDGTYLLGFNDSARAIERCVVDGESLYLTDADLGLVEVGLDLAAPTTIVPVAGEARGVTVDGEGRVYVADCKANQVLRATWVGNGGDADDDDAAAGLYADGGGATASGGRGRARGGGGARRACALGVERERDRAVDKPWDVAIATHNGRHKVYVASNADGWIYAAALSGGALERHVYAPGVRGLAAVNSLQRLFWVDAGALYSIPYGGGEANGSTDDAA